MPDECYVLEEGGNAGEPSPSERLQQLLDRDDWGYMIALGPDASDGYDLSCRLVEGGRFRVSAVWVKEADSVSAILDGLDKKAGVDFTLAEVRLIAIDFDKKVSWVLDAAQASSIYYVNRAYNSILGD